MLKFFVRKKWQIRFTNAFHKTGYKTEKIYFFETGIKAMTPVCGRLPHAIYQALIKGTSVNGDKSTRLSPSSKFFRFKYNDCSKSNHTGFMFMKVDHTLSIGLMVL